jgi:hypothetical protein
MSAVMAAAVALFVGSLVTLLALRRRLGRALEAERLERHVARELAQFDRRCAEKGQHEGEAPGRRPRP